MGTQMQIKIKIYIFIRYDNVHLDLYLFQVYLHYLKFNDHQVIISSTIHQVKYEHY